MYKVYLKQAWALMGQNRFFTAVYIIGTGLAISMVMAIAVVYHIRTANIAPEVSRDRMGYVLNVSYEFNGGKGSLNSGCGPRFVKEVLYGLETPEKVAVTTNAAIMPYEVGDIFIQAPGSDESPKVQLMGCDDAFWQVYRFSFLDGKPFASAEFLSGMPRVVLDRSLARRLLGRTEVAGQTVLRGGGYIRRRFRRLRRGVGTLHLDGKYHGYRLGGAGRLGGTAARQLPAA